MFAFGTLAHVTAAVRSFTSAFNAPIPEAVGGVNLNTPVVSSYDIAPFPLGVFSTPILKLSSA